MGCYFGIYLECTKPCFEMVEKEYMECDNKHQFTKEEAKNWICCPRCGKGLAIAVESIKKSASIDDIITRFGKLDAYTETIRGEDYIFFKDNNLGVMIFESDVCNVVEIKQEQIHSIIDNPDKGSKFLSFVDLVTNHYSNVEIKTGMISWYN